MMIRRALACLALAISACSLTATSGIAELPTATTVRSAPATIVPTLSRPMNAVPTVTAEATSPASTAEGCALTAGQLSTAYRVTANLNYAQHAAMIRQNIRYINRSNEALNQVVLTVEPNQWPRAFHLISVATGSTPLGYDLTGRRLAVDLVDGLEPGCGLDLTLEFQLNVPEIGAGLTAYRGFLGHSPRQLNLGNWLPMIVPHQDGKWVLHDAVLVGEQIVLDEADWDVTINVSGAPDSLEIAGPGEIERTGDHAWHFIFDKARDFTVSLSDQFQVMHADTPDGIRVELYSFNDAQVKAESGDPVDGAAHALDTAVKSVAMYEDLYGLYPHSRLVVVEGDFPDGMEFSGLVFVSRDWFTRYTGNPAAFLTVITAHEVSHQWWYGAVGNDQALDPWLDEALATYSEYAFLEEYYPELKDWWWGWRVDNYAPQGFVDSTVYQFSSIREYINAVYLLGARMLHDLRDVLGTERFFDLMQQYYEAGAGRVVSPDVFWSLLSPEELAATQTIRKRYLRQVTFGS